MESWGYSSLRCMGVPLQWLLLLQSTGSRCMGFSSCGVQAQQLWCTGLVALWHVGSSQTRDWMHVPCIGRQIPNHCTTREVPWMIILLRISYMWWITSLLLLSRLCLYLWLSTIWYALVWVSWIYPTWNSLSFLDIYIHVFDQIWEFFSYYFFIFYLWSFFLLFLGLP